MSIDISALNILDYAIIIILMVSAILSTLRGMTREALGLVGWPIAIFAAKYSAPVIEPMIVSVIKVGGIGQALSWALLSAGSSWDASSAAASAAWSDPA